MERGTGDDERFVTAGLILACALLGFVAWGVLAIAIIVFS